MIRQYQSAYYSYNADLESLVEHRKEDEASRKEHEAEEQMVQQKADVARKQTETEQLIA